MPKGGGREDIPDRSSRARSRSRRPPRPRRPTKPRSTRSRIRNSIPGRTCARRVAEAQPTLGRASSRRSITPTHPTHDRDDLVAAAGNGAERNGSLSLVRRNIVVRHRGPGRTLIRGAMNAEPRREAVQLVGVLGEQMGPFEPLPLPNGSIDINAAPRRQLAYTPAGHG